jgi:Clp amino terminal domain, pathogenicity island component
MMAEVMTQDVRMIARQGFAHALRLTGSHFGSEHFLLALAGSDQPAGAVLRERGVTPERVEREIARRAGAGATVGLFGDLDPDALATIGIDLGAVRARAEAAFGPVALARAERATRQEPGPFRRWPWPRAGAEQDGVFLPHTPDAVLLLSGLRAVQLRTGTPANAEHLALGLLALTEGPVPPILAALGASAPALRAAVLDRYREAG